MMTYVPDVREYIQGAVRKRMMQFPRLLGSHDLVLSASDNPNGHLNVVVMNRNVSSESRHPTVSSATDFNCDGRDAIGTENIFLKLVGTGRGGKSALNVEDAIIRESNGRKVLRRTLPISGRWAGV